MVRIFSKDKKALVRKYFARGLNVRAISKKVDISYSSICQYIRHKILKLKSQKKSYTNVSFELKKLIIHDIGSLRTIEIVNKYGVTRSTIDYLKKHNNLQGVSNYSRIDKNSLQTNYIDSFFFLLKIELITELNYRIYKYFTMKNIQRYYLIFFLHFRLAK